MQVIDFLLYDSKKRHAFKEVWKGYTNQLSELSNGDLTILIASKNQAEKIVVSMHCAYRKIEQRHD